jgi:hypothetical protein
MVWQAGKGSDRHIMVLQLRCQCNDWIAAAHVSLVGKLLMHWGRVQAGRKHRLVALFSSGWQM